MEKCASYRVTAFKNDMSQAARSPGRLIAILQSKMGNL